MFEILIVIIAGLITMYLSFSKKLSTSSDWQATVTPLASIMGSGFLISAPLLAGTVGVYAMFCMAALLVLAYFVGGAIRFNIRYFEAIENKTGTAQMIAMISRIVLVGAYFISVTYYLQLLAAFVLNGYGISNQVVSSFITTALLLVIGGIGIFRGLGTLERLEKYAVNFNLGMIGALLFALTVYNLKLFSNGSWQLPEISSEINLHDLRVLLGLLIVVQGFETSRYLGDQHSADQRIRTMRYSQILSACIYLLFIALTTVLFHSGLKNDVTAIISMTKPVAVVLPFLISLAAICSQFSAAVADNEGAGGLIEDITDHKLPMRYAYLFILIVTIALTWATNVNTIIAYASRAFALYYSLQCLVALIVAFNTPKIPRRHLRIVCFAALAIICFLVFTLGLPSE